ncbi:hypothetical protein [Anabaena sp. CCY 0017]|uniref:hypothetical protein n=1 Tax=Anabaena sp. CCY 0017 TaxID=3103866 RepID=UPI0039C734C6
MPKKLGALELSAAQMLANGATEKQVFLACDKNRSWVQALKRRDDFQEAVSSFQAELEREKPQSSQIPAKSAAVGKTKVTHKEGMTADDHLQKIRDFRDRSESIGNRFLDVAESMLALCEERLRQASADEINLSRLPGDVRSIAAAADAGVNLLAQSLGVQKIMEIVGRMEQKK